MKNKIIKILCGFVFLVCFACSAISCSCGDNGGDGDPSEKEEPAETKYAVSVSVNNTSYGTVSSSTGGNLFDEGANVVYTIKPAHGKCILKVICDGQTKTALDYMNDSVDVSGSITISFESIKSNHSIHVDFGESASIESVSAVYLGKSDNTRSLSSAGGSVSVFGNNISVPIGTAVKFKLQPSVDHELKEISINGIDFYSASTINELMEGLTYDENSNIITVENVTPDFKLHVVFKVVDVKIYLYTQSAYGVEYSRETSAELGEKVYIEDLIQSFEFCYFATQKNNFELFLVDIQNEAIVEEFGDRYIQILKDFVISSSGEYEVILLFSNSSSLGG